MAEAWRRQCCEGAVQSRVCGRGRVAPALGGSATPRSGRWRSGASGVGGPRGRARARDTTGGRRLLDGRQSGVEGRYLVIAFVSKTFRVFFVIRMFLTLCGETLLYPNNRQKKENYTPT